MPNLSKTTKDHELIRSWAEERGVKPSHVKRTGSSEDVGILRLDFPGYSGEESLEPISWEQFFEKFDERGLALVYEDVTAGGQRSNFNKLINAGSVKTAHVSRSRGSTKKAASSTATRTNRAAGKKSVAKKAASSAKRAAGAKKTASHSRTKTKRTTAKTKATVRRSSARPQKKSSTKKSARRR